MPLINCVTRLDFVAMLRTTLLLSIRQKGFRMFNDMIGSIEFDVTRLMMKAQIHEQERPQAERHISTTATRNIAAHQASMLEDLDLSQIGRNELCPCGSGKKFKTVTVKTIK